MHEYELRELTAKEFPHLRPYAWKQIENMRERLAAASSALSNTEADLKVIKLHVEPAIEALVDHLRAEKRYDASDRLRDVLAILRGGGFALQRQDEPHKHDPD